MQSTDCLHRKTPILNNYKKSSATCHASHKACVVVGMSGGVDSSVTAWLLKKKGYKVIGLFMKNWEDKSYDSCSSRQDLVDAVSVADLIGVDIEVVNFVKEYKDSVFTNFLAEYSAGRTPNPDVLCNEEIKFKAFLNHAMSLGAHFMATGHYARIKTVLKDGKPQFFLLKALDKTKDQSYFLYRLKQKQLKRVMFPLGEWYKKEVRRIAHKIGLPNADKKDSTGICFIGKQPFYKFLSSYLPFEEGPILTAGKDEIGRHCGLAFYTLGQRKGIGIGGVKAFQGRGGKHVPWYVARKDSLKNALYVVQERRHPWLLSKSVDVKMTNWVSGHLPDNTLPPLSVKTRYRQNDVLCMLYQDGNERQPTIFFREKQWAVTPGQSAVIYDGDVCLGGGIIV